MFYHSNHPKKSLSCLRFIGLPFYNNLHTNTAQLFPNFILKPASSIPKMAVEHHPASLRNRGPIWEKLEPYFVELLSSKTERACLPLRVLEVAAGTGAHAELFAEKCHEIVAKAEPRSTPATAAGQTAMVLYQQTEKDEGMVARIFAPPPSAGFKEDGSTSTTSVAKGNVVVAEPKVLDLLQVESSSLFGSGATATTQGDDSALTSMAHPYDILFACNFTHISEWEATENFWKKVVPKTMLKEGGGSNSASVLAAGESSKVVLIYGPFRRNNAFTTESNRDFDADLRQRNPSWGYRDVEDVEKLANGAGFLMEKIHEMPANNFLLVFQRGFAGAPNDVRVKL
ncbi:unnamed protein product [Amoebophrya sp. A120]|nr:unnamed protein product [Amoebophrya sp. A120]|eukprot:GSA120T00007995001.1